MYIFIAFIFCYGISGDSNQALQIAVRRTARILAHATVEQLQYHGEHYAREILANSRPTRTEKGK